MKPAAAKVGGNQGRMVGRRLAVGFLLIVPRCFPHRGGYLPITSRGRGVGVSPIPTRRLIKPSSSSTPTVPGPSPPPHEPCAQRLEAAATLGPLWLRCREGRRKSRSTGWAATGRGFPANCPRCFPHRSGYLPITSRGRGVGVSPTPTRRLNKPSSSSTPTEIGRASCRERV